MKALYVAISIVLMLVMSKILPASNAVQALFPATQLTGRVKGTVIAPNESVILNAAVIIESEQTTRKVTTDVNGVYEAELPAGIYEISTEIPGWYPLRRARFCVQPNTAITLTLAPALRVSTIGIEVTASEVREPITTLPPPQYDSFSLSQSSNSQLDLLMQFSKKRARKDIIEYDKATASYNALTVSASKLRLNPKTFRIEANGKVIVEDGKQRTHAKRAEVEFKAGEAIIKLSE